MADDLTTRFPNPDPAVPPADRVPPDADRVPPESVPPPPGRITPRDVVLGAVVFVAVLLLLLGATRLTEHGTSPAPSSSEGAAPGRSATPVPGSPSAPASSSPTTDGGSPAPSGSPSAGPSASTGGEAVLVGAGDIADCNATGDEDTAALVEGIKGTVFTAGDNAYERGSPDEFAKCYAPNWGRFLDRTRPAPGNHDWETAGLAGYIGYYGAAAQGPGGTSWYSYDLATWHIIVLDSTCANVGGCDPASPQGHWLAKDLAASNARCTVAIFHHPRFTSGEHGDTTEMDAFWRPLYAAGVDVIINGHDHDYERFARQDPDGKRDDVRGIREFVVGTGGAQLRTFKKPAPNSENRVSGTYGIFVLKLHDRSYGSEFIAAGNDFRDRVVTEKCR